MSDSHTVSISWAHPRAIASRLAITAAGFVLALPVLIVGLFCAGIDSLYSPSVICTLLSTVMWLPSLLSAIPLLVNRTHVRVDPDAVRVQHGPIPWLTNPTLVRGEVLSFEVLPTESTLALIPVISALNYRRSMVFGPRVTAQWDTAAVNVGGGWSVEAVLVGGELLPIASGIPSRPDAEALRDRLTAWLGRPAPPRDDVSIFPMASSDGG